MKKWLKIMFIFVGAILVVSFIWFDLFFWQDNNKSFEEQLKKAGEAGNVIIIFNSGGFGTVHLDKAYDFRPIIEGTKQLAENINYKVSIVSYYRTEESLLGKAAYLKEMIFNFPKGSNYLAKELQNFSKENPDNKIIMAGLSNGAGFADATMEKITCCQDSIFAMEFGTPFWIKKQNNSNIIYFSNNGQDTFSRGNIGDLIWSVFKAPFKMAYGQLIGKPIRFSEAMSVPGHQYTWSEVGPQISQFLGEKLKINY
ncbi:MAG: hypothetical protein WC303_00750 [Candidatus Paceibacterota bacterium]|jgi:hypothetical protein